MIREQINDRKTWLIRRLLGIGASDASTVLGINPWVGIDQLFDEKTGKAQPKDISESPAVKFGIQAEPLIRGLVALDLPGYTLEYHPFDILHHDAYPFITATLDGELTDSQSGERGVLEIKTGSFRSQRDIEDDWGAGQVPQHYFAQVCQQLAVTGYPFAIVAARLKRDPYQESDDGLPEIIWLYRRIRAKDVQDSIQAVLAADIEFWRQVKQNDRPSTFLQIKGDLSWI